LPTFRVAAEYIRRRDVPDIRLLAVRCYLNTQRQGHLFLVDPGSSLTALRPPLVRLYGLEDKAEVLDQLAVYPTPYDPFDGRQADVAFETRDWDRQDLLVDGILGMNWFERYAVVSLHMPADEPFLELTSMS
jgi:hypothetical protein